MNFNEILVNRLNAVGFPDYTDSVVLTLVPELDIFVDYMYVFRLHHKDTATHIYRPKKVYLIKCSTKYYNNREIVSKIEQCIENAWKEFNTEGNELFIQRDGFKTTSDFVIIEFEQLDIVYQKEVAEDEREKNDGFLNSYTLYYKATTKKYKGVAEFYLTTGNITYETEYTSKPTETNFVKDIKDKFYTDYNIEIK